MKNDTYYPNNVAPRLLLQLIAIIRMHQKKADCSQLFSDLSGTVAVSKQDFSTAINFLKKIDLLDVDQDSGSVALRDSAVVAGESDIRQLLARAVTAGLEKHGAILGLLAAAQWNPDQDVWVVDSESVPWEQRGLRALLVRVGVLERSMLTSRHWTVNSGYAWLFKNAAIAQNRAHFHQTVVSPEELRRKMEHQSAAGARAEEWVLQKERRRLSSHPTPELVTRVSEINVAAGYDIASFRTNRSVMHDWLLEVKSHSGVESFFWTANEIATAKRFGKNYALVLVDRTRLEHSKYEPLIIENPYYSIFEKASCEWVSEVTEWRVIRVAAQEVSIEKQARLAPGMSADLRR